MTLTTRDHEMLTMLADGATAIEIAQKLHKSPRTIEARIGLIRVAFECRNTVQLIAVLIREGWIS